MSLVHAGQISRENDYLRGQGFGETGSLRCSTIWPAMETAETRSLDSGRSEGLTVERWFFPANGDACAITGIYECKSCGDHVEFGEGKPFGQCSTCDAKGPYELVKPTKDCLSSVPESLRPHGSTHRTSAVIVRPARTVTDARQL